MYTMPGMPRPKPTGETKHFQFRMTVEESARWIELFDRAKRKNPYIKETDFNRLLLGLEKDPTIINEQDRAYFQQGGREQAKLLGRAPSGKPRIREVSSDVKRKLK